MLGGLIGSAAWIVIGLLNFYASFAGFVMAAGAYRGYQIFGGKKTNKTIYIIIISVILSMFFAEYSSIIIQIIKANRGFTVSQAISLSAELFKQGTLTKIMLPGLGLGLLFAGLGSKGVIKDLKKDIGENITIERV